MYIKKLFQYNYEVEDWLEYHIKSIELYRLLSSDFSLEFKVSGDKDKIKYIKINFSNLDKFIYFHSNQLNFLSLFSEEEKKLLLFGCEIASKLPENKVLFFKNPTIGLYKPEKITSQLKSGIYIEKNSNRVGNCGFYRFCIFCSLVSTLQVGLLTFSSWKDILKFNKIPICVLYEIQIDKSKIGNFFRYNISFIQKLKSSSNFISMLPRRDGGKYLIFDILFINSNITPLMLDTEDSFRFLIEFEDLLSNYLEVSDSKLNEVNYDIFEINLQEPKEWFELIFLLYQPCRLEFAKLRQITFWSLFLGQNFFSTPYTIPKIN